MADQQQGPVIGITGGMGSGKSTVTRFFLQRFGGIHLDTDQIARELLQPGAAGYQAIIKTFGERFLLPDRTMNRPLLRRRLFQDHEFRRQIDDLLHPLIRAQLRKKLAAPGEVPRVLVEVPLLYEAGWPEDFNVVVVVFSCREQRLRRLIKRDGISRTAAEQALAAQWPLPEKALRADHVVDNSGPLTMAWLQVLQLGRLWTAR